MYDHHNPSVARPFINQLLAHYGELWENTTYGNDSLASVGTFPDDENGIYVKVFVPNATERCDADEEYDNFHLDVCGSYFAEYDTIEEVIEALKDGIEPLRDQLASLEA